MTKYAFILGRETALAAAEVAATERFGDFDLSSSGGSVLMAMADSPLEQPQEFLNRLGGVIKIAKLIEERAQSINQLTAEYLASLIPSVEGRVSFGISVYQTKNQQTKGVNIKH